MTEAITAPVALKMMFYGDKKEIFVKQTKKGCIQELLGCEAKNEFLIYNNGDEAKNSDVSEIGYSLEESSCCMRFCC